MVCCEAADGANPVDVPYRYSVSPTSSGKCNVYKPTALPEDQAARPGLKVCSLLVFCRWKACYLWRGVDREDEFAAENASLLSRLGGSPFFGCQLQESFGLAAGCASNWSRRCEDCGVQTETVFDRAIDITAPNMGQSVVSIGAVQ